MKLLSTNRFTYDKYTKEFVAEISELGGDVFGRVYPDACDLGFTLVSHVTGKETDWVVQELTRDPDGDILFWSLLPTSNSLRANPQLAGVTVTVMND